MANNYTQWSAALVLRNAEEEAWAKARLKELDVDWEELEDGVKATLFGLGYDENATSLEIQWEINEDEEPDLKERYVWMRSEENGNIENAVAFVQELMKHFKRDDVFTLTWADTCDKMRLNEFSGGAVVVTAHEARYMNAGSWAEKQEALLKNKWLDDNIQFARLLCELVANWDDAGAKQTIKAVAESMDLTFDDVNELFDRAEKVWGDATQIKRME